MNVYSGPLVTRKGLRAELRDYDLRGLHEFAPHVPVNLQEPLMIWWFSGPREKDVYDVNSLPGWRVFNKDAISFADDGSLLLANKPTYIGAKNALLSKEMRSWGALYLKMKWPGAPEAGVQEGFGWADTGWYDGVCVEMKDTALSLVAKRENSYTSRDITWNPAWAADLHDYYLLWDHDEAALWIDGTIVARLAETVPVVPLDIGFYNWSVEGLTRSLKMGVLEYYPHVPERQSLTEVVFYDLELRDTDWHYSTVMRARGPRITLMVDNGLDQECDLVITGSYDWAFYRSGLLASGSVAATTKGGLDAGGRWTPYFRVDLQCAVEPGAGAITVMATAI